jgi:hypothetical protein
MLRMHLAAALTSFVGLPACPPACRALAQGLARNQGRFLGTAVEEQEAGELVPLLLAARPASLLFSFTVSKQARNHLLLSLPYPLARPPADQLRLAVAEALCRTAARRNEFAPAVYAVEAENKMQK